MKTHGTEEQWEDFDDCAVIHTNAFIKVVKYINFPPLIRRGTYWEDWRENEKSAPEYNDCNYLAEFIDLVLEIQELTKVYPKIFSIGKKKKIGKLLDKARTHNRDLREAAKQINKKMKNKKKNKGKYGYK